MSESVARAILVALGAFDPAARTPLFRRGRSAAGERDLLGSLTLELVGSEALLFGMEVIR